MCQEKVKIKIGRKLVKIDKCLASEIKFLNERFPYLKTVACCCGHGKYHKTIFMQGLKTKEFFEYVTGCPVFPEKRRCLNFYVFDKKSGLYYNPVIESVAKRIETGIVSKYKRIRISKPDIENAKRELPASKEYFKMFAKYVENVMKEPPGDHRPFRMNELDFKNFEDKLEENIDIVEAFEEYIKDAGNVSKESMEKVYNI